MTSCNMIGESLHNTVELTSVCRGEWCRSLESKMDDLVNEMYDSRKSGCDFSGRFTEIREGYRNLGPDIHV